MEELRRKVYIDAHRDFILPILGMLSPRLPVALALSSKEDVWAAMKFLA